MANYKCVTQERFKSLRWQRSENYLFAANQALASIVANELSKTCVAMPLGFHHHGGSFGLVAIQGLQPAQNLFVAPDGRWLGRYTPARYRGHPFTLARVETDRYALCLDIDSGMIGEDHELPFYQPDGELAQPVKDVLNFLEQIERNRVKTISLCAALDDEGLIVPWEITVNGKDGQTKINDLYRIDEAKLNSLDSAALARLHQAGALPVAYCQLISMQHIHTLAKLADAHAKIEAQQQEAADGSLGPGFFGSDGKIDFSSLN